MDECMCDFHHKAGRTVGDGIAEAAQAIASALYFITLVGAALTLIILWVTR